MTIGQQIISNITLSVEQADEVSRSLDILERSGSWDEPAWATELTEHYRANQASVIETIIVNYAKQQADTFLRKLILRTVIDATVRCEAWKAVAKAYKRSSILLSIRSGIKNV